MRIVFMGTPQFAADILANLVDAHQVVGVFTRPDAVRGRGDRLVPSPVKRVACEHGIEVIETKTLRTPDVQQRLFNLNPDVVCVAAFGALLPREILEFPRFGCLNVHASLLPRWRGAAPIEHAILAGDTQTGVAIMHMEEGLDTGDYCVMRQTDISEKSASELTSELSDMGSQALLTALAQIEAGTIRWIAQDHQLVTYADKIEKGALFVYPTYSANQAARAIQASSPAHPTRAYVASRLVTIHRARVLDDEDLIHELHLQPGRIRMMQKRLFMGFASGVLELLEVQPAGKRPMSGQQFAQGIQNVKSGVISWAGIHDELN